MSIVYDPALVVFSVLVAIIGSLTGLLLTYGYKAGSMIFAPKSLAKSAAVVGGSIWAMHFIAMLAVQFPVLINYDATETFLSFVVAVFFTAIGLSIASAKGMGWSRIPLAGLLMGLGIAGMHYLGMEAIRGCGLSYDLSGVALSVGVAVSASAIALWFNFRRRGAAETLLGGVILGLAIAGMHYTGMYATSFFKISILFRPAAPLLSQTALALFVGAILFSGIYLLLFSSVLAMKTEKDSDRRLFEVKEVLKRLQRFGDDPVQSSGMTIGSSLPPGAKPQSPFRGGNGQLREKSSKIKRLGVLVLAGITVCIGVLRTGYPRFVSPPGASSAVTPAREGQTFAAETNVREVRSPAIVSSSTSDESQPAGPAGLIKMQAAAEATRLLTGGRVSLARQALLQPELAGTSEAAWLLARSYDPAYLATLPSPDAPSDKEQAVRWYKRWREISAQNGLVMDDARFNRLVGAVK